MSVNIFNKSDQSLTPLATNLYSEVDLENMKTKVDSIGEATLTIKQNDAVVGTFGANATSDVVIDLGEGGGGGDTNSWTGTTAEWEALDRTTLEDGTLINITDDTSSEFAMVDASLSEDSTNPVQNKVIKSEIDNLKDDLSNLKNNISDTYSASTTYAVGDFCIYDDKLWKCLVECSAQTPSEGTYWTQTTVDSELKNGSSNSIKIEITVQSIYTNVGYNDLSPTQPSDTDYDWSIMGCFCYNTSGMSPSFAGTMLRVYQTGNAASIAYRIAWLGIKK